MKLDANFLIVSKILSYTEVERIDLEELERIERRAILWPGGL